MAIGGGAKNCQRMWIEDGQLKKWPKTEMTTIAVSDVDLAVQRLLDNKVVYVDLYGQLPLRVEKTLEMVLKKGGIHAAGTNGGGGSGQVAAHHEDGADD